MSAWKGGFAVATSRSSVRAVVIGVRGNELILGYVTKAGESVHMRTGKMAPFTLKVGQNRDLEWGGPVIAEFDYTVEEETVTVPPNVAFYGRAGEEYHTFWPEAKSPKIIVTDKKTNKVLTSGRFGGC